MAIYCLLCNRYAESSSSWGSRGIPFHKSDEQRDWGSFRRYWYWQRWAPESHHVSTNSTSSPIPSPHLHKNTWICFQPHLLHIISLDRIYQFINISNFFASLLSVFIFSLFIFTCYPINYFLIFLEGHFLSRSYLKYKILISFIF